MEIAIDSDLNCHTEEKGCTPIVFVPDINLLKIDDVNIINAF
jgi:hypothetical protein